MAKSVLNLHRDPVLTLLPWIMGLAAFIFCLSLVAFITAAQNSSWGQGINQDEAVVVVPWQVDKLSQKERINRVVELIIETPGLSDVYIMSEEEQKALLAPWLGNNLPTEVASGFQLAIPTLIKLKVSKSDEAENALQPNIEGFRQQLALAVEDSRLVINRQVSNDQRGQTWVLLIGLAGVLAFALTAMVLIILFTIQILLKSQASAIATLQQLGATKNFIRKQFQSVAMRIGLAGGLIAAIFTGLTAAALWFSVPHDTFMRAWLESSLLAFPISILVTGLLAALVSKTGTWYGLLQSFTVLENLRKV